MATFYKGVAGGTTLAAHDLMATGLAPRNPGGGGSLAAMIAHIRRGTTFSAYISLTKSYGIAENYAQANRIAPSVGTGHVYEVHIDDPPPQGVTVIDPVAAIAGANANPLRAHTYHHNGDKNFLLGVVDTGSLGHHVLALAREPPNTGATPRPPYLSDDLEALVRALRDAEVLVIGNLPRACFVARYDV
jgi:hypothetical protein